jgi:hypothetical protein
MNIAGCGFARSATAATSISAMHLNGCERPPRHQAQPWLRGARAERR